LFSNDSILRAAEGLAVGVQHDASVLLTALVYPLGVYYGASVTRTQTASVVGVACTRGGSYDSRVVKSTARDGLGVNDWVETTFNNCAFETDSSLNGRVLVVNSANLLYQGVNAYTTTASVGFERGTVLTQNGRKTQLWGTLDTHVVLNSQRYAVSYATRPGQGFLSQGETVTVQYGQGFSNLRVSPSRSSGMPASTRPEGPARVTFDGRSYSMFMDTEAALAGTEDALGYLNPTAGRVHGVSFVAGIPNISITMTGNTATVFGDSNSTGFYDSRVLTTWSNLWVR
jgi:hypothetical protein